MSSTFPTELNIDIESLFKMNFNYNFDILKIAIAGLINHQKGMHNNISQLKKDNKNKDNLIKGLISKLKEDNILKDFDENQFQDKDELDEDKDQDQAQDIDHNKDSDRNDTLGNNNFPNYQGSKEFNPSRINDKLDQLIKRTLASEDKIKEMADKMKDIDILKIFKVDNDNEDEDKDSQGTVSPLEIKFAQKLKNQENRLTKNEEDIYRFKTELNNLKNSQDSINRTAKANKESIEGLMPQINDLKSNIKILNNQLSTEMKNKLDQVSYLLNNKIKEYDSKLSEDNFSLKQIVSDTNKDKDEGKQSLPNDTLQTQNQTLQLLPNDITKQIIELKKHIIEAEKNIIKLNPDSLLKEIKAIKDELGHKCTINKYTELAIIVDDLSKKMLGLKDQIIAHTEDSIGHEDTKLFKKKIEFLMTTLFQLQQSSSNNDSLSKQQQNLADFLSDKSTKYLEIVTFNEFKDSLREQLTYLNDQVTENRKLIDELFILVKQRVSNRDLKEMEEALMGKLEDLKLACQKKFADKLEMGKNMKFLDAQLKHILEINIKRSEKGENWLLANKPLGGHNCASCENYIGDLKESNHYIPWNKYPMRDQSEKLYRLGNGFSKMLQMVGNDPVSEKREKDKEREAREQFATSQEFFSSKTFKRDKDKERENKFKESERNYVSPQKESLPKLNLKINSSLSNLSDNENGEQDNLNMSQEEDNDNKPKM